MRILHVFKTYYPDSFGGIERVIHQLTSGLGPQGVESRVFVPSPHVPEITVTRHDHVEVIRVPCRLSLQSTPLPLGAFEPFRQALRECDLVHYHFPWPFGDLLHLCAGGDKPAIATYHSDIVRQKLMMPLYRPLMNHFLGRMRRIVAASPNYLSTSPVLQRFRAKVDVIPYGLDEAGYPPPSQERLHYWEQEVGRDFFLFVGVLRYYKGLHILLDACAHTDLPVVIMGAGPVEGELREQARTMGPHRIRFLGALENEDRNALLHLCKAVIFPSHLRSEAFGIALLEGAMHAKPLISCEIGTGSGYVNVDGVTGHVVPPSDPAALRQAMQRLLANPAEAERLGRQARQRYRELFTAPRMVGAYLDLYRAVLAGPV